MGAKLYFTNGQLADRKPLYEKIRKFLADTTHQAFYLVPRNQQLAMEFEVLQQMNRLDGKKATDQNAMFRLQVTSFRRLAWYLDINVQNETISDTGLAMLVKKIVGELSSSLPVLGTEANYLSFGERLVQLFDELSCGNLHSNTWQSQLDQMAADEGLNAADRQAVEKMRELAVIYKKYEEQLDQTPLRDLHTYERLVDALTQQDFSNTLVVIDHFAYFSAEELRVIEALIENAAHVAIVLEMPETPGPGYLFQSAEKIDDKLSAANPGQETLRPAEEAHTALSPLADYWRARYDQNRIPDDELSLLDTNSVQIWQSESVQVEAEQAAALIYHLVSEESYRYRDVQIFVRDFDRYTSVLAHFLRVNEIPFFVNHAQSMAQHPLARFTESLYRIYQYDWRYRDVFDLLRTELLFQDEAQFRDVVDEMENDVLKHGYEGRRFWDTDYAWSNSSPRVQHLRTRIFSTLNELFKQWDNLRRIEGTTPQYLVALYDFLIKAHVYDQLMTWREALIKVGDIERAEHQEQVWKKFVDTLDEANELFGGEALSLDDFFELLQAAFAETTYRVVPPTVDSVTISDYEEPKPLPGKVSLVLGLTDHTLPRVKEDRSLLSAHDRELMQAQMQADWSLDPTPQEKYFDEPLVFYHLLQSATDRLILSYPYNGGEEGESNVSPYVTELETAFDLKPLLKTERVLAQTSATQNHSELILGNASAQWHQLVTKARLARATHRALPSAWNEIQAQLTDDAEAPRFMPLLDGIEKQPPKAITPEHAQALYGEPFEVSVSALETYNKDPFGYFLKYGLRIKERERFEIDAALSGSYYHKFLETYYNRKKNNPSITFESVRNELHEEIEDENRTTAFDIFTRRPIFREQWEKLDNTIERFIQRSDKQLAAVKLKNSYNEKIFDYSRDELGWAKNNHPYRLRGKIDRIDSALLLDTNARKKRAYFQVVDYKSSNHSDDLKLGRLYDGVSLQLYTYFSVVWDMIKKKELSIPDETGKMSPFDGALSDIVPIGFFYDWVDGAMEANGQKAITEQSKIKPKQADAGTTDQWMQEQRLRGYYLADVSTFLDTIKNNSVADVENAYRLKLTKNDSFNNQKGLTSRFTHNQFEALAKFVEKRVGQTVDEILSGKIILQPIVGEEFLPSLKEYKAIARYDQATGDLPKRKIRNFGSGPTGIEAFFKEISDGGEADHE